MGTRTQGVHRESGLDQTDVGYVISDYKLTAIEAVWESDPSARHEKQWADAIEKALTIKRK